MTSSSTNQNSLCLFSTTCSEIIAKYPRVDSLTYRYGTSGFRGASSTLDSVMIRMGFLGVLRSLSQNGQAIGLMITASHNDECDNGVKIVDPSGEMMDISWENTSTAVANTPENELSAYLNAIYDEKCCPQSESASASASASTSQTTTANLFIGRDTRPHSLRFSELMIAAANAVDCKVIVRDFGEITTPYLHYAVMKANADADSTQNEKNARNTSASASATDAYMDDISSAFISLMNILILARTTSKHQDQSQSQGQRNENENNNSPGTGTGTGTACVLGELLVDCANGVGGLLLKTAVRPLSSILDLALIHLPSTDVKVNDRCGAEHVHKRRALPLGLHGMQKQLIGKRMASVDGDCDRLMYYCLDAQTQLCILDGDKQICLVFSFVQQLIEQSQLSFTTAVVQTAYANGSSTEFLAQRLHIQSEFTSTGVKHLHERAKQFEIAIYYEANGHGTLLMQPAVIHKLKHALALAEDASASSSSSSALTAEQRTAITMLLLISRISNQAIGDAFADLLLIEASLYALNWSIMDWHRIYVDRPASLTKLKVKDRTIFATTNAERTCVEPPGLQAKIDALCAAFTKSRAFVRPSGTEDCVRVYSEATTRQDAHALNLQVRQAVYDMAGGVGNRP